MKIQGQELEIIDGRAITKIKKPFYNKETGLTFSLNNKVLNYVADYNFTTITVETNNNIYNIPLKWIRKNAKRVEKVVNFPDNPMVFYEISLTKFLK